MRYIALLFSIFLLGCSHRQPRRPVSVHSSTFLKESAEKNRQLLEEEQAIIDSIITKDTMHEYHTSKAGFKYYFKKQNKKEGYRPQFGDKVIFSYSLSDIKGKSIYSTEENKFETYYVDKEELFFGLRNAIKLLQENEMAVFYFPSEIAFGYHGDNDKIGSNLPVLAEVIIHKIEKNTKTEN